jgi:hypothetical protein
MTATIGRRALLTALGGAAAALPLAAGAQCPGLRVKRSRFSSRSEAGFT